MKSQTLFSGKIKSVCYPKLFVETDFQKEFYVQESRGGHKSCLPCLKWKFKQVYEVLFQYFFPQIYPKSVTLFTGEKYLMELIQDKDQISSSIYNMHFYTT